MEVAMSSVIRFVAKSSLTVAVASAMAFGIWQAAAAHDHCDERTDAIGYCALINCQDACEVLYGQQIIGFCDEGCCYCLE
jgi:hypothetical protein